MGGNDIAYLPKTANAIPPTDHDIITAIKEIALEINKNHIIPIVIPILPREDTKPDVSGVTNQEYCRRKNYINWNIERELKRDLGFNPIPFDTEKERKLLEDGVHLTYEEYQDITVSIILRVNEITEKMTTTPIRERRTRKREEDQEEVNKTREQRSKTEEITEKLENKARKWRLREEKQIIVTGHQEKKESNKQRSEEKGLISSDKTIKVLELATIMKSILTPEVKDACTQTASIFEILPQLLEEMNIKITQHNKNKEKTHIKL